MYAISIFCSLIDIQPFDQPNVESTKITTKSLLETKNIDETSFLDKSNLSALVKEIKENKGIISLLIHGTNKLAISLKFYESNCKFKYKYFRKLYGINVKKMSILNTEQKINLAKNVITNSALILYTFHIMCINQ